MNRNFSNNGVRLALTEGHFNDKVPNDCSVDGLGIDLGLSEGVNSTHQIEIANIQNCPNRQSEVSQTKNSGTKTMESIRIVE